MNFHASKGNGQVPQKHLLLKRTIMMEAKLKYSKKEKIKEHHVTDTTEQ